MTVCLAFCGLALSTFTTACWSVAPSGPLRYVSTFAGSKGEFGEPFGIVVRGKDVLVSDGSTGEVHIVDKTGSVRSSQGGFDTPSGLAVNHDDVFVVDTGRQVIYRLDQEPALIAGMPGKSGSADGDAAAATFNGPIGIAVDGYGRIFVADTYNDRIRVIENGKVTTLAGNLNGFADGVGGAASFNTPTGLAMWNDKLLVADTGNHRIRVVEMDGRVWTLAGSDDVDLVDGPLLTATLSQPTALAVSGNIIYVADGNVIRRIDMEGERAITTVSGGTRGLNDGEVATTRFNRPSGLVLDEDGDLLIADSDNRLVRRISPANVGTPITPEQIEALRDKPDVFRNAAPGRWPFDPPTRPRDIAGTLGELRGEVGVSEQLWFHNGLDIAGTYGETARFIRDEKVLLPIAVQNFGTLRELIRMPSIGYIHLRLGRFADESLFGDRRFQLLKDDFGKLVGVRVPRGTRFRPGEPIGTLNPMNHVHLVAGRPGAEMNALDALEWPGLIDTTPPTIEMVRVTDENGAPVETAGPNSRIRLTGRARVIARVFDQMDGGSGRRRLGPYKLGYQVLRDDGSPATDERWTISFALMPSNDAVSLAYAPGSKSGAMVVTIFDYVVTNVVNGNEGREGFLDAAELGPGIYRLRVMAADRFENRTDKDIQFEVIK